MKRILVILAIAAGAATLTEVFGLGPASKPRAIRGEVIIHRKAAAGYSGEPIPGQGLGAARRGYGSTDQVGGDLP